VWLGKEEEKPLTAEPEQSRSWRMVATEQEKQGG